MEYLAEHWPSLILTVALLIFLIFHVATKISIEKWDLVYKTRALIILLLAALVFYNGVSYFKYSSIKEKSTNDIYNSIK
ncbi:hypothetical protein GQ105_003401 [Salmonella enterica]|nr:hypothetical protein [Salmonella enterica]